jgi:hypothetical protein
VAPTTSDQTMLSAGDRMLSGMESVESYWGVRTSQENSVAVAWLAF